MIGTWQNDEQKWNCPLQQKAATRQKETKQVIFLSSTFCQVVTKALLYEED